MNTTKAEQERLSSLVDALNNISRDKIYKTSQGNIQMRPKVNNDGNGWGDIEINRVLEHMKSDIIVMGHSLITAKNEYIQFRQLRQEKEQAEIDAILGGGDSE